MDDRRALRALLEAPHAAFHKLRPRIVENWGGAVIVAMIEIGPNLMEALKAVCFAVMIVGALYFLTRD